MKEWLHSRFRLAVMAIGIGAVILYEVTRAYYRPYVYAHGIYDFHLADTLGNSLGTLAMAFSLASIFGRNFERGLFVLRNAVIGAVVYELLHPLLGKRVDPWDIVATLFTGVVAEIIFRAIHRAFQKKA